MTAWIKYGVVLATGLLVMHVIFAQGEAEDQLDSPIYHATLRQALDRFRETELMTSEEGQSLAPGSEGATEPPPPHRAWTPPVRSYTDPPRPLPRMYPKTPAVPRPATPQPHANGQPATPRPVAPPPATPSLPEFDEGRAAALRRDYDQAIPLLQKALEKQPDHTGAMHYLGNCYMGQRQYDKAIALFEKAATAQPDSSQVYYSLGYAYRVLGKTDQAIAALEKSLELGPSNPHAVRLLVPLYQSSGQAEKVEAMFSVQVAAAKKALGEQPDNAMAYATLAGIYTQFDRDLEEALTLISRAVELEPGQARYLAQQAGVLLKLGRRDQAAAAMQKAIELEPANKAYELMLKQMQGPAPTPRAPSDTTP